MMVYTDGKGSKRGDLFTLMGIKALITPDTNTLLTPLHYCFQMKEV